jgi:hypothetical protein
MLERVHPCRDLKHGTGRRLFNTGLRITLASDGLSRKAESASHPAESAEARAGEQLAAAERTSSVSALRDLPIKP